MQLYNYLCLHHTEKMNSELLFKSMCATHPEIKTDSIGVFLVLTQGIWNGSGVLTFSRGDAQSTQTDNHRCNFQIHDGRANEGIKNLSLLYKYWH